MVLKEILGENRDKKQVIHLGWQNMTTIFLAIIVSIIAFVLWKENSVGNILTGSNAVLPTNATKLKINVNKNFN
jgi:hypothetical protein